MDWKLALSLTIPALVAVAGWLVAHFFSARRDVANRRREQVTKYLLEAYRRLEKGSNPREPEETWGDIESAIADIQLLGSKEQVRLATLFAQEMGTQNHASTSELLVLLRKSLRNELSLENIDSPISHLRFNAVSPEEHIKRLARDGSNNSLQGRRP